MAIERHVIELTVQDRASASFKKVGDAAEDAGRRGKRSAEDWGRAFTAVGAGLGGVIGVMSKLGQAHIAEERQIQAVQRAYGESADTILDFTQKLQDMGIASDDNARIAALGAQSLAKNYGFTTEQINELISRSADLSAVTFDQFGQQLGLADVMQRVAAAMRGEGESAEILGVAMSDSALAAAAAAEGLEGWNTTMTEGEKAAFRFKVFMDQTASATGAAAEQADTATGKVNALKIQMGDLASEAGGALGPLGEMTAVLGNLALVAPVAGAGLGKLAATVGTLIGGAGASAGVVALGSALATVGVAAASLAAPIGIATYLFIDQKNVVREATEATLANQEALEGYIAYLNSINVEDSAVDQLSQQMKELLDWTNKSAAAGFEALIDPNLNVIGDEFVTTLGEMNATLRELSPENLEKVVQLMNDLGIVTSDPNTWNAEDVAHLTEFIYLLGQEQRRTGYDAIELTRAQNNLNDVIGEAHKPLELTAEQTAEMSIEMVRAAGGIELVADNFSAATPEVESFNDVVSETHGNITRLVQEAQAAGTTGLGTLAEGAEGAAGRSNELSVAIAELGSHLAADIPDQAGRAYNSIVGYTDGLVGSIEKIKDWSDELLAPLGTDFMDDGTPSRLLQLMSEGKLDVEDYNEALEAQIGIYDSLNRAQTASEVIQIRNADALAAGADATADYLENLSKLPEEELAVQLAWADTDIAGRAMEIANMASEFDNMTVAEKEAFGEMVTSAAATDPQLAAILESLGLIKQDLDDPTGWTLATDTSDSESDLDRIEGALNRIATALEIQYMLSVGVDFDEASLWTAIDNLPDSHLITVYYQDGGYYGRPGYALGGMIPWEGDTAAMGRAGRGMTLVGEHGPELVNLPGGSTVIPNHASRYMDRDRGWGGMTFTGPITVVANDPQSFMRQMRSYTSTMERR